MKPTRYNLFHLLFNFQDVSRAIDGFAPSTDSAAPSIDPSMAQQSVDGAALSVDAHGTDSARSVNSAASS